MCCCDYLSSRYLAYYKASLIKVISVFIYNAILSFYTLYKLELASNNYRIFAEGSLIVILSTKSNFELRTTLNECLSLVLTNRVAMLFSRQRVSYILYYIKLGQKSSYS